MLILIELDNAIRFSLQRKQDEPSNINTTKLGSGIARNKALEDKLMHTLSFIKIEMTFL